MTLELKDRRQKFLYELSKYSENKDDPISEWYFTQGVKELSTEEKKDKTLCICSTPISVLYNIKNKINKLELEIGCECIKRWLNPKIECNRCKCVLGNITKRMRTKDYLCRCCKKMNDYTIGQLSGLTLNNKAFYLYSNITEIEYIINKPNKSYIEELFEKYINNYYEIQEIEI
jgi:hypothetical protein